MIKTIFILIISLWVGHSSAQSWYSVSNSNNPIISINSSVVFKHPDTMLVVGLTDSTIFDGGWSNRILRFINPNDGISYREALLPILKDGFATTFNELLIHKNNIYISSILYSNDSTFSSLYKLNINGQILWVKNYDTTNYYSVNNSITSLNDTTLLLCGEKETSFGNLDMRLMWLDTNGNVLNERVYNLPLIQYAYQVEKFPNGELLLTGASEINATNYYKTFHRLAANGDIIWQKNLAGNGYNAGSTILTSDTSIYWGGYYAYPGQINRPRILKLNQQGDTLWSFTRERMDNNQIPNQNSYEYLVEAENNSITSLGRFYDTINNRVTSFLQNITSEGEDKWLRKISIRIGSNYVTDLLRAQNGDYIFSGYVVGNPLLNQVQDGWLVRCNCIGLFQGPEDSLQLSQSFNSVSVNNFANNFQFSTINWGDETAAETIESNYSDSLENIAHTHAYAQAGTYTITQKTIACNDTLVKSFSVSITFTPSSFNSLSVFPNPNSGNFSLGLTHSDLAKVSIYENSGKIVYQETTDLNEGKLFNLEQLSAGMYHVLVEADGAKWNTKIVLK